MDINSILPLLFKNKTNSTDPTSSDTSNNNDGSMALIQSLLSGTTDQSTLISTLANSSNNPQLAQTLNLANNIKNSHKPNSVGLRPIKQFANNDIIGKLSKYFS
jgi:hypothetical protein